MSADLNTASQRKQRILIALLARAWADYKLTWSDLREMKIDRDAFSQLGAYVNGFASVTPARSVREAILAFANHRYQTGSITVDHRNLFS